MPSKSKAQEDFMKAAAHDKEFAEKNGIDQEVAREFVEKDKQKKEREDKENSSND